MTQKPEVTAPFERIQSACGRINVLMNLAGGAFYKDPIQDVTPSQWKECLDLNLKSMASVATTKRGRPARQMSHRASGG